MGEVAASPVLGMLQTNQNSPCSSRSYGCCALTAPVCSGSLTQLVPGELWTVAFCIGSLLWCKPALFSKESALRWLPALQDWLMPLLNQSKFCPWVQLRTSSFFHTPLPLLVPLCLPVFYHLSKVAQL